MSIFNPADIGYVVRQQVMRLGTGARLFVRLILSFSSWLRPSLIRARVFFFFFCAKIPGVPTRNTSTAT